VKRLVIARIAIPIERKRRGDYELLCKLSTCAGSHGPSWDSFLALLLTVERSGAVVVGVIAALPVYVGAGFLLGHEDYYTGIVVAVLAGGASGYLWWEPPPASASDAEAGS
jgi:hypothetical protein